MTHERLEVMDTEPGEGMTLELALVTIDRLKSVGVDPVLFGSLGASVYLGNFKTFGDIDLLVHPRWVEADWNELQTIMQSLGFKLINEKEHEFRNTNGTVVAFAGLNVFERDKIEFDPEVDIVDVKVDGLMVRTFSPGLFLRAYEYSVKDGYRTAERGKKDEVAIERLQKYLLEHSETIAAK